MLKKRVFEDFHFSGLDKFATVLQCYSSIFSIASSKNILIFIYKYKSYF